MATGAAILLMTVAAHAEMVTIEEFIGRGIGRQIGDTIVNKALEATIRFKDLRLYGRATGASLEVIDASLKDWATKNSGGGSLSTKSTPVSLSPSPR
jgi:hypothetical protein